MRSSGSVGWLSILGLITPYAGLLVIRQMLYQSWALPEEFYPKTKIKGVPITTPSMLGVLNMEHNTGTQVTKAAKVEQNTEQKAKHSTL